jgi:hypothetical protein
MVMHTVLYVLPVANGAPRMYCHRDTFVVLHAPSAPFRADKDSAQWPEGIVQHYRPTGHEPECTLAQRECLPFSIRPVEAWLGQQRHLRSSTALMSC